jgi:hypothetical protein
MIPIKQNNLDESGAAAIALDRLVSQGANRTRRAFFSCFWPVNGEVTIR